MKKNLFPTLFALLLVLTIRSVSASAINSFEPQLIAIHSPPDSSTPRHAPENAGRDEPVRILFPDSLVLNEGFEGGVVPPDGWSEIVNNQNYNWEISIYGTPHSGDYAANVEYDDKDQDEWLLSPSLNLTQGVLSFWSQGSVYYCRDHFDNCDLKAWIVVGAVGGGDDIYLGKADDVWPASWTWAQSTFNLTPVLPGGEVRIGFEYVGNDGAQILLDDITLDGSYNNTALMSLPAASGAQNELVQVPLYLANVGGLVAATFTVTYDGGIVNAVGASAGSLAPGWSLVVNTGIPGQVRVSMASPGGSISGSGVLATIDFQVVGLPGSSSLLGLSNILLNDGAIPVQTTNGSFSVDAVYSIAGTIQFWNGGVVSDTLMTLNGNNSLSGWSGADGSYLVSGVAARDYTLTPVKTNQTGGISAYDASLALQHDAGLITLSGGAAKAADVNKNGAITSMDAFYILQKSVNMINLPFPGAGAVWSFSPSSRSYFGLAANLTGQDFQAILLGDPSGNWTPEGSSLMKPELNIDEVASATLSLPSINVLPGETFSVPLNIDWGSGQVFGADIEITYDSNVLTANQVQLGSLVSGWSIASNLNTPGLIRVAMAGATPIAADGELLRIVFIAAGQAGLATDLRLTRGDLNEGQITSALVSGHVNIATPVQVNFSASPTAGPAPLSVTFTNLSSGNFTTSLWDFGDGTTSTASAPSHIYAAIGSYTVTLTISGPGGNKSLVRAGYIQAYGLNVSGRAGYWASGDGLEGVGISLNGASNYSTSTNSSGVFTISNVLVGNYTLAPGKEGEVNGITAYDASLVLQHLAGLITLSGYSASAADVNNSGTIGTIDASYILQKAVGLIEVPFPGSSSAWEFSPPNRSYLNLNADKTGQDFIGILLGDPSGNWQPGGPQALSIEEQAQVRLSVQSGLPDPTGLVTVTIFLDPAGAQITSLDLKLSFDPNNAQIVSANVGPILTGWMFAHNKPTAGEIWIGLASPQPVAGKGIVVLLVFQMNSPAGATPFHFIEGLVNEGSIPSELVDGRIGGISVYLPMMFQILKQ